MSFGSGAWIGYVYDGGSTNFSSDYYGFVNFPEQFDTLSSGDSLTTSDCTIDKNTFTIRLKMRQTFACGVYNVTIGGDDGVRLSIDGGATFAIDGYTLHSYQTFSANLFLDGSTDLVLEYFENTGQNRVSFSYPATGLTHTGGLIGSDQTFCGAVGVVPDTLTEIQPAGICGAGSLNYQWQISSDNSSFSYLFGATNTFYPFTSFPNYTSLYYRRRAIGGTDTAFSNTVTIVSQTPQGDQVTYGVGSWIGYVYDGANNFTDYRGFTTEPEIFDQSFVGSNNFININGCQVFSATFTINYRMQQTFPCGTYLITIGGDDGVRLSIDGGATYIIDGFVNQAYTEYTATVFLDGSFDLVVDYYDNESANRVSFNYLRTDTVGFGGTISSSQSFCSIIPVNPDAFTNDQDAAFCIGATSYQWQESADSITFTNIGGATSSTYDLSTFGLDTLAFYRRLATNGTDTLFSNVVSVLNDSVAGDEVTYGSGSWIGYVYDGANNFSTANYQGFITETEMFDESFTGNATNHPVNGCDIYTETFTVRFRMRQTFARGVYEFTIGGDDGVRLSLDGGSTYLINDYTNHGYRTRNDTITLDGTYDLVLEYYEQGGGNRVSFDYVLTTFTPLPVTWNGVQVTPNERGNLLTWQTGAEWNCDHFWVERSTDLKETEQLAQLGCLSGGEGNEGYAYHYLDQQPLDGQSYYRLQQVDFNGAFEYSPWVSVTRKSTNGFQVEFDPNYSWWYIGMRHPNTFSGPVALEIFNVNGQILFSTSLATLPASKAMGQLPAGLYFLRLSGGTYVHQSRFLVP
ncbi:MAG: T9SS type A sorting domain-containing protein [Salibacteraceae bacterium]